VHHRPTVAAYNATEEASDGLSLARALADLQGNALVVARVLRNVVRHGEHDRATQRDVRSQLDETRRAVVAAVPEAGGADVVPIIDPRLARGLHDFAEAEDASMLVLGSSHLGPLGRRLIGGTADVVLSGAPCPVAVAPPDYKSANPLSPAVFGVAYDGSPTAKAAFTLAVGLAQAAGAKVRLIAVHHDGDAEGLERGLAEAAATVPSGVACETVLEAGDPVTRLLDEGENEVGLLLAGSRGHGPLRRVLLGSVSRSLVRSSRVPVIVVPPTALPHREMRRGLSR
jgi:nucleotide-binding universal stress UspA family protein